MTDRAEASPRVAFVTGSWSYAGGAEQLLFDLVRGLDHHRFEPVVVTLFGDGRGRYAERARAAGIPIRHFRFLLRRPARTFVSFARLVHYLRRERFAVVHGWQDRGIGVLAGLAAGVPARVQTIHALDPKAGVAQRLVDRVTIGRAATRTVAVSQALARGLAQRSGNSDRISVILNGAAPERLTAGTPLLRADLGIGAHAPIVLFAGRLSPEKGCDVALNAFAEVVRAYPEAMMLIIGDGPERQRLDALASRLGIGAQVRFAGHQRQPGPWFRLADVVAMPSRWEALGITALEAMALGKPVVASNIGGLPEAVLHGTTGLLPEPRRWQMSASRLDPAPFAEAMVSMFDHPEQALAMGRRGQERFLAEFTMDACIARYEAMYERLTGEQIIRLARS